MLKSAIAYYGGYTPVGDIIVLASCMVFAVLIRASYINKTKTFVLFRLTLVLLAVAGLSDISWHVFLFRALSVPHVLIYLTRALYHLSLFSILLLYVPYAMEVMHMEEKSEKCYLIVAAAGFFVLSLCEILGSVFRFGFYLEKNGTVHLGVNLFPAGYVFFSGIVLYLLVLYHNRVYRQVMLGVVGAIAVAFVLLLYQTIKGQVSYTTSTFLFTTFALLYLLHSNPYDVDIGAVNLTAFEDLVKYSREHGQKYIFMSLYLQDFEIRGTKYPRALQETIRRFVTQYFKNTVLFSISNGHMLLSIPVAQNPHYDVQIGEILGNFVEEYPKYRLDYKIVITSTYDVVSEQNDYVGLIQYIEDKMTMNQIRYVKDEDIDFYNKHKYILKQLEDIYKRNDLDDPRVLVFCQPVLNITTGCYDTAEALMRITLEETGMVFPDQFIPLAEKHGFIHTLSCIILHKTCMRIRNMLSAGYNVKRISVNISMIDVKEEKFCENVSRIISESGIPYEKIAIEITESQSESDFVIMKKKIEELRQSGIKFYLDDFGTGFSNFERIMQLPFDIIKFDRSLVIASGSDRKSMLMVEHLAKMFSDMNYSVLYEGVESEQDEERCEKMSAKYLQGYKYSRPIPIEKLTEYFEQSVS